jgi:hypothetical protein
MEPLSVIKNLFFSWYQFTLENPGYPGIIALLTALVCILVISATHRGKLAGLKRKFEAANIELEQDHEKTSYHLNSVEQQLQQAKEQLQDKDSHIEQITKNHQAAQAVSAHSAAKLEAHINQRNQDLANAIQTLEAALGVDQPSAAAVADANPEALWQRHASVVKQLSERLQSNQKLAAELQQNQQALATQLSGKEAIIQELQETLEAQNSHISQLTRDVQAQKDRAQEEIEKIIAEFESKEQAKFAALPVAEVKAAATAVVESVQAVSVAEAKPEDTSVESAPKMSIAELTPKVITVESVQESPVIESVSGIIEPVIDELVQKQPSPDKKSWFSPLKAQLETLTGKDKTVSEKQTEQDIPSPVTMKSEAIAETAQATTIIESVSEVPETIESGIDKRVEPIQDPPLVEKKSWFNPVKAQFGALTSKLNPAPKEPEKVDVVPAVEVVSEAAASELSQDAPAVELVSKAEEATEPVANKVVNAAQEPSLPGKKSWFSSMKSQFDELTGKDKYYG